MVLPYVQGLSESMKNVGKKHGIQTYFKGGNTIKSLLMTPKGKDSHNQEKWHHLQIQMQQCGL